MPDNSEKYTQENIPYYIGRISGTLDALQRDITDIKDAMIPNGKERLDKAETKVQALVIWHKSATAVGVLVVGIITWVGGFFNG